MDPGREPTRRAQHCWMWFWAAGPASFPQNYQQSGMPGSFMKKAHTPGHTDLTWITAILITHLGSPGLRAAFLYINTHAHARTHWQGQACKSGHIHRGRNSRPPPLLQSGQCSPLGCSPPFCPVSFRPESVRGSQGSALHPIQEVSASCFQREHFWSLDRWARRLRWSSNLPCYLLFIRSPLCLVGQSVPTVHVYACV